jgi:hypothetical protein
MRGLVAPALWGRMACLLSFLFHGNGEGNFRGNSRITYKLGGLYRFEEPKV